MDESQTNNIDTWAVVEIFGHQKIAGHVTTANFGSACMLRVDVPDLPAEQRQERRFDYEKGEYVMDAVELPAVPRFTRYLGVSSIFSLTPCTQEFAIAAQRRMRVSPPSVVEMPAAAMLPGPVDDQELFDEEQNT